MVSGQVVHLSHNQKFSCIIIAIEQPGVVVKAIDAIRPFVDEIILLYSDKGNLLRMKERVKDDKRIRVFYTIQLGLPELYKRYAESLCSNDWIIALDTDERFNSYTLSHLADLAVNESIAYRISRKESNGRTWQFRIWKKGSIRWRGFVHEHPLITGKLRSLGGRYQIVHHHLYTNAPIPYNSLQKYQGEAPGQLALRDWVIEYIATKNFRPSRLLDIYKKHSSERNALSECERKIVREVKERGIAEIIGSTTAKGVGKLNERYGKENKGVELLIQILKDKYCD